MCRCRYWCVGVGKCRYGHVWCSSVQCSGRSWAGGSESAEDAEAASVAPKSSAQIRFAISDISPDQWSVIAWPTDHLTTWPPGCQEVSTVWKKEIRRRVAGKDFPGGENKFVCSFSFQTFPNRTQRKDNHHHHHHLRHHHHIHHRHHRGHQDPDSGKWVLADSKRAEVGASRPYPDPLFYQIEILSNWDRNMNMIAGTNAILFKWKPAKRSTCFLPNDINMKTFTYRWKLKCQYKYKYKKQFISLHLLKAQCKDKHKCIQPCQNVL